MSKRIVTVAVLLMLLVSLASPSARADIDTIIDTFGGTPFVYGGRSYLPLKSAASFLGAPLRWDSGQDRMIMDYDGRELVLTPGSRNALYEGRPVTLSAAPLVGGGRLYVPLDALRQTYGVPVEWDRTHSRMRIMGSAGWGAVAVSSSPPGWVHGRKMGWAKHGDATRPPGLSKQRSSHAVTVAPRTVARVDRTRGVKSVHPRVNPGSSGKAEAKGAGPRVNPGSPRKGRANGGPGK